ncbi:MAG TPA: Bax inhibitor-1/YccA family protein, partial [Terriglobales bacterium]
MADLMKTANPTLGQNTFRDLAGFSGDTMTVSGAVNKTGILVILCVASAAWTWNRFFATGDPSSVAPMMAIGGIGG